MGGEERKVNHRLNFIQETLALACGETLLLFNQKLKIASSKGDFVEIMSVTPPHAVSTLEFTRQLSSLQIEQLLQAATAAQDKAAPISFDEVKERFGINGSVLKSLRERVRVGKSEDFVKVDTFCPF